ncbi:hypothetical protein REH65_33440 (plasmid) [Saccharopolyspora sp. ID03-671]|uniref:hypothetical protein n=1 Tax=Saccharopolyspora sp. ID03-671 TaxID=3073066 RepID=UPI0030F3B748
MAAREYYQELARSALLELVDRELAVVTPAEVEAKLADQRPDWLNAPSNISGINPHHLGWARNHLLRTGKLRQVTHRSRGERDVNLLVPADQHLRYTAIRETKARKAKLHARYLGWGSGTQNTPGILGVDGESIVHQALLQASINGCVPLNPNSGQTRMIAGASVRGGALDNAAWLYTTEPQGNRRTGTYVVPIEVKNVRHWLYSGDYEVHQLLFKAAWLQHDLPDEDIVPVLVCRQANHVTMTLARALGFQVVNTKRQAIRASLDGPKLAEVVTELGYNLQPLSAPDPALVRHFAKVLPGEAAARAERWRNLGSTLTDLYDALRNKELHFLERDDLRAQLADAAGITDHTIPDGPEDY